MPTCPTCRSSFEGGAQFCPKDGTALVASAPSDPLVGRVLGGRYRLVDRLGQGGMGTVYRALHTLMDKPLAVKILRGDLAGDAEAAARFHREARSASRLDHEHCIRVTDFGQSDDGLLFLVMELLDGESLSKVCARGPVDPRRAATIALQIAGALIHAHEQGVIHRDLKPDNVYLIKRGRRDSVKVLDFGLAKISEAQPGSGPSITKAGVVFGTPEYMAPEQAEAGQIDARTDLYALGVMLYQMLVGDLPFRAASFLALLGKQVDEAPVPPRERRPDLPIPPPLEAIALRLMAKDPDDRFQSALDLAAALDPFADQPSVSAETPATSAPPPGPSPPPIETRGALPSNIGSAPAGPSLMSGEVVLEPKRRRGLALGLGALAVLGAAAIAVVLVARHPGQPPPAPPPVQIQPAPPPDVLTRARTALDADDLDEAGKLLAEARARGDSVDVQLLLGELAEKRGNRLEALAHLHRATRIAPDQAEPHARLASLLNLLGQAQAACREAKLALGRDGKNSLARVTSDNSCKEPR